MAKELDSSSRIRLNVRGKEFCTTVDTLTQREPNSMLAAMFSGRHALNQDAEKGWVFIDRDGQHFWHILNWLRDGAIVPTLQDSEYQELLKEAEYFQLLGLIDELRVHHVLMYKRKENGELRLDLTRKDIIDYIQSDKFKGSSNGRSRFKGANISGLNLSELDLSQMDFSYTCMKEVDFTGANLTHAKFDHADGEGASFDRANLQYSEFYMENFPKAHFSYADLHHAKTTTCMFEKFWISWCKVRLC